MPIANSTAIATRTTSSEMMNPCSIGFAPERQRDLKSVFRPMAARAATNQKFAVWFLMRLLCLPG